MAVKRGGTAQERAILLIDTPAVMKSTLADPLFLSLFLVHPFFRPLSLSLSVRCFVVFAPLQETMAITLV